MVRRGLFSAIVVASLTAASAVNAADDPGWWLRLKPECAKPLPELNAALANDCLSWARSFARFDRKWGEAVAEEQDYPAALLEEARKKAIRDAAGYRDPPGTRELR
jgi:hypothetical protein